MPKPKSFHENLGCHNCKYIKHFVMRDFSVCSFGEENISFQDLDDIEEDDEFKKELDKINSYKVPLYGHCEKWERKSE